MNKIIHNDLKKATEEKIKSLLEENEGEISMNNLEALGDLIDIHKDIANEEYWCIKEESEMYGNYGNYNDGRGGYGNYGEYGNYGRYGRDSYGRDQYGRRERDSRGRYKGHDYIDNMYSDYGRYEESRGRYGASEETDKAFHYMNKSLEDFIRYLFEDADNEQQKQMIRETLQRSMM